MEIGGDVLAHGGVGAPARFDGDDAVGGERGVADQEFGVLPREDVVGYGGEGVAVPEGGQEGEEEGGFAGADGAVLGKCKRLVEVRLGATGWWLFERGGERRRR